MLYIGVLFTPQKFKCTNHEDVLLDGAPFFLSFLIPPCSSSTWESTQLSGGWSHPKQCEGTELRTQARGISRSTAGGSDWLGKGHVTSEGVVRVNLKHFAELTFICAKIFASCLHAWAHAAPGNSWNPVTTKGFAQICRRRSNTKDAEPRTREAEIGSHSGVRASPEALQIFMGFSITWAGEFPL